MFTQVKIPGLGTTEGARGSVRALVDRTSPVVPVRTRRPTSSSWSWTSLSCRAGEDETGTLPPSAGTRGCATWWTRDPVCWRSVGRNR